MFSMRNKSDKTKNALGFGKGDGKDYKPYIEVGEFGSLGTAACVIDYKTGRTIHLLSQAEVMAWYLLRWDDDNLDIKEQYPLPIEDTLEIAEAYGLKHPCKGSSPTPITSDFVILRKNGTVVISIKSNSNDANFKNLFIEKKYWESQKTYWKLIEKHQMNLIKYRNIRNVVYHYNDNYFPDEITFVKFLIARKLLVVDINNPINYKKLLLERKEDIDKWKQLFLESEIS